MSKNIISLIQDSVNSPKGKVVMNYMYSWGAAIVILGTLFKLTHMAGANLMLFLGMGAEVLVFFLYAFERPDNVEGDVFADGYEGENSKTQPAQVIINSKFATSKAVSASMSTATQHNPESVQVAMGIMNDVTASTSSQLIPQMDEATKEYIESVHDLNEAIQKISQQSNALSRNMEEMETLGRNLTGINALYEIQLRSASNQTDSIDMVNKQTRRMVVQIEELNEAYSRMLQAMKSNMGGQPSNS